ncbi:hypothetical protein [Paraclostridium sordellii]|uniref:hypothetical protein n=1 Tax=Paraclostridium sordellii TaxID=1505 RepID=UPI001300E2EA|nr:hypothetical protein [Paeniclostridium sordellii]
MMSLDDIDSWSIIVVTDELLNFIIFMGCMYDLIGIENFDKENEQWPTDVREISPNHNIDNLRIQWKNWFSDILKMKSKKVKFGEVELNNILVELMYDIDSFKELDYKELREYCIESYPIFMKWWNMPAGGKNALEFHELIESTKVHECIMSIENKIKRKSKPFKLHVDVVYTGVPTVLDFSDNYIVITPNGHVAFNKNWWMRKLKKLV